MSVDIVFIVAAAENGVIGRRGAMPWRLPSDLKRLKALTIGKPVIMGRKTYNSIGKPLPGRTNIVLTRDKNFRAPGVLVALSREDALAVAKGDALRRGVLQIAVIGGAEIYALFMDDVAKIELTRVHERPEGDAFFDELDAVAWEKVAEQAGERGPNDSAAFSYLTYRRRA